MKILNALILSILCSTALISQAQTYDENIRMSILERQATKQFVEKLSTCSIGYAVAYASLFFIGCTCYPMGYKIRFKLDLGTMLLPWLTCAIYSAYNNLQIEALEDELSKLTNKK